MIHIAPALITRTRGLRRHPRHHHQQWEATVEKVQHNLLCGHTTRTILSYSHDTSMCLLFGLIILGMLGSIGGTMYPYLVHVLTCHFMCLLFASTT